MLVGQENGKNRLQQAQEDVEEVKVIMLDNLNKADERSGRLGELEDRADELMERVSGGGIRDTVHVENSHYTILTLCPLWTSLGCMDKVKDWRLSTAKTRKCHIGVYKYS